VELLSKLLEAVPAGMRLPLVLVLIALYFGYPFLQDWRANKLYWDFRRKELELMKLYYELEPLREAAKVEATPTTLLEELKAQLAKLRPNFKRRTLKYPLRLLFSALGSATGLLLVGLVHVLRGQVEPLSALLGVLLQAVLPAIAASAYPSERRLPAYWFGFGAGLLFHLLTIAIYLSSRAPSAS
jgi:hypothetical protein